MNFKSETDYAEQDERIKADLRARLVDTEAERDEARADAARKGAMLVRLQFSQGPGGISKEPSGKCPVCLGWDGSPKGLGETRMRHAKDCELAAVLSDTSASEAACGFREDAHQCNLRRGHNGACEP